jgi:putative transposase
VLAESSGNASALCSAVGLPRASYYRLLRPPKTKSTRKYSTSPRALTKDETERVIDVLHDPRFLDKSPAQIYATLLDERIYICSIRTMYRILHSLREVRERRNIVVHPNYPRPVLLATGANQVWTWDITKLKSVQKSSYYNLYVIIDIFSRYVVGWLISERENSELAQHLIAETCQRQRANTSELIIHSDRGPAMTSKPVAMLLADLGITKSLNRPHVSNDNPYSESHFKTLKYNPHFPSAFGSIEDARSYCKWFFHWYNYEHRHSGIALMTPGTVHYGEAQSLTMKRQQTLNAAFQRNPERFVRGLPEALRLRPQVWINQPPDSLRSPAVRDTKYGGVIISGAK